MNRLLAALALACAAGCAQFGTRPREFAPAVLAPGRAGGPADAVPAGRAPEELPDRLGLEEALRIAWAQSPTLEASFQRLEAARARVSQSWAAFAPSVQAGLSAQRTLESALPPSFAIPGFNPDSRYWTYGTSLTVSWLLFDGLAREHRLQQARAARRETAAAHEELRRLVSRSVGAAFFSVLLAREQLAVARDDLVFNRAMLEDARKRQAAGVGSEADVLAFTLRVNAAESENIGAEGNLRVQRFALAELLGVRGSALPDRVRLAAPTDAAREPGDGAALVRRALEARPDLAQARAAVERADAAVAASWGAFFPSLAASVQAGHSRRDDAEFSVHDLSATAGFSLSWTLFGGGARFAGLRAARAEALGARAEVERVSRAVTREVLQSLDAADEVSRRLLLARENAALSLRLRDMEAQAFARGATSRSDLDQVQRDHTRSLLLLAMNRIEEHMARFNLDVASGASR